MNESKSRSSQLMQFLNNYNISPKKNQASTDIEPMTMLYELSYEAITFGAVICLEGLHSLLCSSV